MQLIDRLLAEAESEKVQVVEHFFRSTRLKGLYCDGVITINKAIDFNAADKACILAEELGHHHTSSGIILDQSNVQNRKQERKARQWAYERLIPLERIIEAHLARVTGRHELAECLGVTEDFLQCTIDRYRDIYGLFAVVNKRFTIYFEPLSVCELFIEEG